MNEIINKILTLNQLISTKNNFNFFDFQQSQIYIDFLKKVNQVSFF